MAKTLLYNRMKISRIYIFFLIFIISTISCKSQKEVKVPSGTKAFNLLSEYQLFKGNLADLIPEVGVIPYDLNTPLYSDYAQKARFVWMPENETAVAQSDGTIQFPLQTILVKNFFYETNGIKNIIETRLLIHTLKGWNAVTYVWNKEQTDAKLEIAGATVPVIFEHLGKEISFNYSVPNKIQCKNCHNVDNELLPIGPKIANLNRNIQYFDGEKNQLDYWNEYGYLDVKNQKETPVLPAWDNPTYSLEQRSKAYLDVNCGHCHSAKGLANTSGLFLQYFGDQSNTALGICKTPVAAGRGSGGRAVDIKPGHPDESILLYRMESEDPGVMMPEIGRKLVHQEAIDLIHKWIEEMESVECL
ncbi:MAG TPA: SO2930 family diheme c-type cytochrome [Chitinophagales bacterium]|nr:SO2930 family diheme c-type cytochrome [Chitinophagales bacterium]